MGHTDGPQVQTEENGTLEGVTSTTVILKGTGKGHDYNKKNTLQLKGSQVRPEEYRGTKRYHEYD